MISITDYNVFLDNKYTNTYLKIVQRRKSLPLEGYVEKHHILPKSLGGLNDISNIVELSAREHFVCHLLLTKMVDGIAKNKMCWALHRISFSGNIRLKSHQYEIARRIHSKNMKTNHPSRTSDEWTMKVRTAVASHWNNNEFRKQNLKVVFKKYREENFDAFLENARKASKLGIEAYRKKNLTKIEYKGSYYYSWQHLKNETNVSKHLYNKYYIRGIDPEFRINSNGPISAKGESVK